MASFSNVLKTRLAEQHQKAMEEVAEGIRPENYREQVGYMRGIRDAIRLCEEIERENT
jgi:hypothetical protein